MAQALAAGRHSGPFDVTKAARAPGFLLLLLMGLLCGCAAARPAAAPSAGGPPAQVTRAFQPLQAAASGSAEDDLLLEDELGLENQAEMEFYSVPDPLEKFNRAMFLFNDKLYFWLMKPVAQGYGAVVPQPGRSAVKNFFANLAAPVRIVNNILQGKARDAEAEWARFLYNSTVGVLGFGDPASENQELVLKEADFGQTLGIWGLGDGFFLFWPVFGPSTLRDSAGLVTDYFLDPTAYLQPFALSISLSSYEQINNLSLRIGDYETLKKAALDPYIAIRDGYIQLRQAKIKGAPSID